MPEAAMPRDVAESLQVHAMATTLMILPMTRQWKCLLLPPMSHAVDMMISEGDVPLDLAESLDDFGHFCQRLASDIMAERKRRGMPEPWGPDDIAEQQRQSYEAAEGIGPP